MFYTSQDWHKLKSEVDSDGSGLHYSIKQGDKTARKKATIFITDENRIFHNTISQIAPIIEISKIVEN